MSKDKFVSVGTQFRTLSFFFFFFSFFHSYKNKLYHYYTKIHSIIFMTGIHIDTMTPRVKIPNFWSACGSAADLQFF